MRPSSFGRALGAVLALMIAAPLPAVAQAQPSPPKVRTGKERLGQKWTDEQRTDNCKVPIDKRGTTPRPDTCPDALTQ